MKNGILGLLIIGTTHLYAECVSHTFVTDYCYFGIQPTLSDSAISIEPKQYGYEASTLVEVKLLEKVDLLVVCNEGPLPLQTFDRVRKDERLIISKERYKPLDAVVEVKSEYQRLRTRLSNYLCKI